MFKYPREMGWTTIIASITSEMLVEEPGDPEIGPVTSRTDN